MVRARPLLRAITSAPRLTFAALAAIWSVLFGLLGRTWTATLFAIDLVRARRSLRGGTLHCPRGHAIETEGGVYRCARCNFCYRGSIWVCGSVECGATTPYVDCPDCGLSVRNPYRLGRP